MYELPAMYLYDNPWNPGFAPRHETTAEGEASDNFAVGTMEGRVESSRLGKIRPQLSNCTDQT